MKSRHITILAFLIISKLLLGQQEVLQFTLVDAENNLDIIELTEGIEIDYAFVENLGVNIRATTNPGNVGSVIFTFEGPVSNSKTENVAPYALFGDSGGDYYEVILPEGNYTLTATPYSGSSGSGTQGTSLSIQFTIAQGTQNEAPIAIIQSDLTTGEAPLTVAFDALGSSDDNGIVSYFWDFKDGGTSNLADPTNTFTTAGDYDVELTVTDGGGLSDTASITVQVAEPTVNQPPVAVPGADVLSGEAPLTVAFDALGSSDDNGIVSYFWDFKDGGTSNLADPTNTFTTAGDYDVELTVTDGGGLSDTASITVQVAEPTVNQPPVAVPGADVLSGEAPLTVAFDALGSSDDNGIVSYFWDFKDGGTSNLADPTNTFTTAGDYDVELTVTDGGGLSDTASITVQVAEPTVNQPPVAVPGADVLSGEAPLTVAFDALGSSDDNGIVSYFWGLQGRRHIESGRPDEHLHHCGGLRRGAHRDRWAGDSAIPPPSPYRWPSPQ